MSVHFVLTRIDDRLIHGQVAVGWVKATTPDVLLVADDQVLQNPMQRSLMEITATPAFEVKVCGVQEAAEVCDRAEWKGKRVLLLFSSARDVTRAVAAGLPVREVNVGGMRYSPGKRQILKAVAIDQQDVAHFKQLLEKNIRVSIQMVPTDEPVDIRKYL